MAVASIKPYPNEWLTRRPTPFFVHVESWRLAGFAVRTTVNVQKICAHDKCLPRLYTFYWHYFHFIYHSPICCKSLQVKFWFASNTKAAIPAANGADADVPVCETVHEWCKSVVTICRSSLLPLLYVVASVELHFSEYHGTSPRSVALDIDNVQIEFV